MTEKGQNKTNDVSVSLRIKQNLETVLSHIQRCCHDYDRSPESVKLIAVSKTHSFNTIQSALINGQNFFGENYVQEAEQKWSQQKAHLPDLELHMVGPLQSNKARQAIELFDVIHSLDRISLAKEIAKEFKKTKRRPQLFIQVNTGEEPQKGGVTPEHLPDLLVRCRDEYGLDPQGLMCIPPAHEAPSPHFALLAKLAERFNLPCLSMGMSEDYETAIQMGATHIRVGSAIFGARYYQE